MQVHNTATRLLAILDQVVLQRQNTPTFLTWSTVFKITESEKTKEIFAVSDRLQAMHSEIENLERKFQSNPQIRIGVYTDAIKTAKDLVSPIHLNADWNVTQQMALRIYTPFQHYAVMLPHEEDELTNEEIDEIKDLIKNLKDAVDKSELKEILLDLIRKHIQLLESSLSLYPISGISSFKKSMRVAAIDLLEAQNILESNSETDEVGYLFKAWGLLQRLSSKADTVDKALQLGISIGEKVTQIIKFIP